eukprot:2078676-Pleurochrysis_carterae.AAC.3
MPRRMPLWSRQPSALRAAWASQTRAPALLRHSLHARWTGGRVGAARARRGSHTRMQRRESSSASMGKAEAAASASAASSLQRAICQLARRLARQRSRAH